MINLRLVKKFTAVLANLCLLFNPLLPFIIKTTVYAQSTEEIPIPEPIIVVENNESIQLSPTPEIIITPIATPTAQITFTPEITPIATSTAQITLSPTPEIIITPIATPTAQITLTPEITPIATSTAQITLSPTPEIVITPEAQLTEIISQASETEFSNQSSTDSQLSTPIPIPTPTPTIIPPTPVLPIVGEIETIITQNDVTRTDLLNPSLSTNKPDYHPTEIAIISGHGFFPNTEYFLHITSDGLDQTYQIISDSNGNFNYSYQLDDVYRPQYQIEIKNQLGEIVDTMSFTDSRWVTLASVNDCLFTTVSPKDNIAAKITVSTWNGVLDWNNDWHSTQYTISGQSPVCVDTVNYNNTGFHTESFNITAPSEYGVYNITFKAFSDDNCTSGFINEPLTLLAAITVIDTTPPITTITSNPDSLTNNRHASFSFTSNKSGVTECKLDDGLYLPCTSPKDYFNLSDGSHIFSVRAIDTWLNVGQPSTYSWTIDNTSPPIPTAIFTAINGSNILLNNIIYTNSKYFKFNLTSGTDTIRYRLKYWNDIPDSIYKSNNPLDSTNLNALYSDNFTQGEGVHHFIFSACDTATNCSEYSTPFTIVYDKTLPTSIITSPTNTSSNSIIYSNNWDGLILGTATDNLSQVKNVTISIKNSQGRYFNGTNFVDSIPEILLNTNYLTGNWEYNGFNNPSEDTYIIKSHAIDNADNMENTYTLIIVLDKTIPEVGISLDPGSPDASNDWYKTQPKITLTPIDANFDKIQYQWNSQSGFWTTYSIPFPLTTEGAHVLYYRAADKAANISSIGVKNINWDKTELELGPQNIFANPNPTSGSTSKINWEFAKDNIGIDKYEIKWRLNNTDKSTEYSITVGAGTTQVEIDQLIEGRWTIKVIAFDTSGKSRDNSIDLIVDRTSPIAPNLILTDTSPGTANLSWNAISDAQDYIIWYGNTSGQYLYGARVGNVTSYTVNGLGTGNYYFIIKAVDAAQNQSNNSNEVNTGNIVGAINSIPNQPAQNFTSEVLGTNTEDNLSKVPRKNNFNWWWLSSFLGIIPLYGINKKFFKKK